MAARGSAALSIQAVVSTLVGLGFYVVIARFLGPFGLGLFAATGIVAILGGTLGSLGLPAAAARFAAFLEVRSREIAFRRTLVLLTAAGAMVSWIVLDAFAPLVSNLLVRTDAYASLFRLGALLVAFTIPAQILDGWTQGRRAYARLAGARLVARVLSVGLGIALVFAGFGVAGAVWSLIANQLFLLAFFAPAFARGLLGHDLYPTRAIVVFSLPLMASGVAVFGANYVETLLIVALLATADLGVYSVALTIGTFLILLLVGPFTTTILPASSRVASRGGGQGGIFAVASRYVTLLVLPASVGVAVLSQLLVALVGGAAFKDAVLPAALIAAMTLPFAISAVLSTLLQAEGKTGRVFLLTVAPIAPAFAMGLVLVPAFGLVGAALVRNALYLIGLVVTWLLVRGSLRVGYDWNLLGRSAFASAAFGLPLYLLQSWNANLVLLPAYVLLGLVIYFVVLRITGTINGDDRQFALQLLPRRLAWIAHLI